MIFVLFSIGVAAAEAAVGLALILAVYRHTKTTDLSQLTREATVSLPMAPTVWIVRYLWLIPVLPLLAAGIGALLKQSQRRFAAAIAIASIGLSFVLAMIAFAHLLLNPQRLFFNFPWMQFGFQWVKLGWMLDPLAAVMLVMVTFVALLIFVYSVAYMHHDENFTRFFCFLSLFAAAMLGLLIANSLLLLFMCWEVVGLTSYLLIGFWYERPPRRLRLRRRSSPRGSGTSVCCWAWCGSTGKPGRCYFTITARDAWSRRRSPRWPATSLDLGWRPRPALRS